MPKFLHPTPLCHGGRRLLIESRPQIARYAPRPPHLQLRCSRPIPPPSRHFSSSSRRCGEQQDPNYRSSFSSRLRAALRDTKVEWYPIPVGIGIAFLGFAQLYRVRQREKSLHEDEERRLTQGDREGGGGGSGKPKKRKRIRPSGPW